MPRLTEATKTARRSQILDAAFACFSANGYAGTSMADIIRESGLSSGSIYSHFSSKAEIFSATIEHRLTILNEAYRELPPNPGPRDILRFIPEKTQARHNFSSVLQLRLEAATNPEMQSVTADIFTSLHTLIATTLTDWARLKLASQQHKTPTAQEVERLAKNTADALMVIFQGYLVRLSLDTTINEKYLLDICLELLPD